VTIYEASSVQDFNDFLNSADYQSDKQFCFALYINEFDVDNLQFSFELKYNPDLVPLSQLNQTFYQ
jgi:hypothetical protein